MLGLFLSLSLLTGQGPAGVGGGGPAEAVAAAPRSLHAVLHRGDVGLRDLLIRHAEVRWDGGALLVALIDQRLEAALAARGVRTVELMGEEDARELWAGAAGHGAEALPAGAELLHADEGVSLWALAPGTGLEHGCHGGVARVSRRAILPPAPASRPGGGVLRSSRAPDPRIQALIPQVSQANLVSTVSSLSSLFSRRATRPEAITARNMIRTQLQGYGLTVTLQSFDASMSENVIAQIPGARYPNEYVVIGAHYDSINLSGSTLSAPGADDNASGSAGVLEIARILAGAGPFERTLRFVTFSGEELGLLGSAFDAAASRAAGQEIVAMLNMDMIAYRASGDARDCDFVTDYTTGSLIDYADATGALYVSNWASQRGSLSGGTSDHQSYFSEGFPSVFFFEDNVSYYPNIHTSQDTMALATTDFVLAEMIVEGVLATAASIAEPLDLSIAHTPLVDTQSLGPYTVQANVTSLVGSNVTGVELHWSDDGGQSYATVAMAPQGGSLYSGQIPGAGSPVTLRYYLTAEDDANGTETLPEGFELGEQPFSFFVGVKTVLYSAGFEGPGDQGWTHGQLATQDDWQRGVPQGQSGDPSSAFAGTSCWGNDLGPSGFNGEYQPNVWNWLRSPNINCSAASSVSLELRRWLTVEDAVFDQAEIWVENQLVWTNPAGSGGDHTLDSSWVPFELDVTSLAAGNAAVQVEFRLRSDGGLQFGGWNLDELMLVEKGPVPASIVAYGCGVNPAGSLTVISGLPAIGTTVVLGVDNPLGTQAIGSFPILALSLAPDFHFPCGSLLPGFGMGGVGELLVDLSAGALQPLLVGAPWTGPPAPVAVLVPNDSNLIGLSVFTQGALFDPSMAFGVRIGFAEAVELRIGP